jgi:CubicO group peptidase (beta-lactamase class C family)
MPGRFGWDAGFGTSAYAEPTNDFIGILLTQRMIDRFTPATGGVRRFLEVRVSLARNVREKDRTLAGPASSVVESDM